MGQALSEETQYHEGLTMRPNMLDYRIPTIVESPPIDVHLVQSMDPLGPFGAKEASEGALHGFPPALTNAVFDAIGIRLRELPLTPDRVLEAIHARRRDEREEDGRSDRRKARHQSQFLTFGQISASGVRGLRHTRTGAGARRGPAAATTAIRPERSPRWRRRPRRRASRTREPDSSPCPS